MLTSLSFKNSNVRFENTESANSPSQQPTSPQRHLAIEPAPVHSLAEVASLHLAVPTGFQLVQAMFLLDVGLKRWTRLKLAEIII